MKEMDEKMSKSYEGLKNVAILIRDFGMPVMSTATGIVVFVASLFHTSHITDKQLLIGFSLVFLGFISHFYAYTREKPRAPRENGKDIQTQQFIDLIKEIIEKKE